MANAVRALVPAGLLVVAAALLGTWLAVEARAQADKPSMAGAWTLNKDLSDKPTDRANGGDTGGNRSGAGGGRRRGGFGGGGFGGGYGGRRGYGGGGQPTDPQATQRMREAMRDIVN